MVYGVPLSPGGLRAPRTSSPGRGEAARPRAGSRTTPRARGGFELPARSERSREPISTANPRRAHAAHPSHAAGSPSCQRSPEPPFHVCHRNRQSLELARPSEPTEPTQHQSIFASFTLQVLAVRGKSCIHARPGCHHTQNKRPAPRQHPAPREHGPCCPRPPGFSSLHPNARSHASPIQLGLPGGCRRGKSHTQPSTSPVSFPGLPKSKPPNFSVRLSRPWGREPGSASSSPEHQRGAAGTGALSILPGRCSALAVRFRDGSPASPCPGCLRATQQSSPRRGAEQANGCGASSSRSTKGARD